MELDNLITKLQDIRQTHGNITCYISYVEYDNKDRHAAMIDNDISLYRQKTLNVPVDSSMIDSNYEVADLPQGKLCLAIG